MNDKNSLLINHYHEYKHNMYPSYFVQMEPEATLQRSSGPGGQSGQTNPGTQQRKNRQRRAQVAPGQGIGKI